MKNILVILDSAILGVDVSSLLKNKGLNPILKFKLHEFPKLINSYNPDLIITKINSNLVENLQKELSDYSIPLLFLNDSIKEGFDIKLIKAKWDLVSMPIDVNEFNQKIDKLLEQ